MATRSVIDPDQQVSNWLWLILVPGLFLLIILGFVFGFVLTVDGNATTDPSPFFTLGTSALTGLLGLFVSTPVLTAKKKTDPDPNADPEV